MKQRETVLLTGGGGGIGLEMAKIFFSRGYNLIVVSLLQEELEALEKTFLPLKEGQSVVTIQQDLSETSSASMIYNFCTARGIAVDILVNNAGIGIYGRHIDISSSQMLTMLNLNIITGTELVTLFGRGMEKRKKGKILITASTAAFQPLPMMAAYGASKSCLLNFARALSYEMKPSGVRVSCLCPGTTRTNFLKQAGISSSGKTSFGSIAFRMQGDPEKVARAGYRGLMKGKKIIVPGVINRLHYYAAIFLPGGLVSALAYRIFKRGYEHGEGRSSEKAYENRP